MKSTLSFVKNSVQTIKTKFVKQIITYDVIKLTCFEKVFATFSGVSGYSFGIKIFNNN